MNKPLLWTLRVLAVAVFAGVLTWQVTRRQNAGNVQEAEKPAAETPGKNTMFLSGSKSYTGAVTVNSGTLVIGEKPKAKEAHKPPPVPATPAPQLSSYFPSLKDCLSPSKPEWKCNQNRQAMVIGTRLIGPQDWGPAALLTSEGKAAEVKRLLALANDLLRQRKNGEALAALQQALVIDPNSNVVKMTIQVLEMELAMLAKRPKRKPGDSPFLDPPIFIHGSKSGVLVRFEDIDPKTLKDEFGVDLDLAAPPPPKKTP